jgi:hypothetical protein
MRPLTRIEKVLRYFFRYKDMSWEEIDEQFTRFFLWETRWGSLILHRLYAPQWHPKCHDHPWDFRTLILWGGYEEWVEGKLTWQPPLTYLYRSAEFSHNVRTKSVAWSILWISAKRRDWGLVECGNMLP